MEIRVSDSLYLLDRSADLWDPFAGNKVILFDNLVGGVAGREVCRPNFVDELEVALAKVEEVFPGLLDRVDRRAELHRFGSALLPRDKPTEVVRERAEVHFPRLHLVGRFDEQVFVNCVKH